MTAPVQNKLCSILTTDLNSTIRAHKCKGTLLRLAAIVSAIAAVVIFGALSAVYLGLLATPPSWAIILALASALGAMKGLELWTKGSEQLAQGAELRKITRKSDEIQFWGVPRIEQYFRDNHLDITRITNNPEVMRLLNQKSPGAPLKALIPLIARELVLKKEGVAIKATEVEHLGGLNEAGEATGFNQFREKPQLEYMYFKEGIKAREALTYNRFNRAVHLQNLLEPTRNFGYGQDKKKNTYLLRQGSEAPIGTLKQRDFETRCIEYSSEEVSGIERPRFFFIPTNDANQPLTTDRVSRMSAAEVREVVFGNE